MIAVFWF